MSRLAKQAGLFVVAIVVLLVLLALLSWWPALQMQNSSGARASGTATRIPPPAPALTAAEMVKAQNPNGFQLLISYVNTGFEPRTASVKAGDIVRFTNNSTQPLWVASVAANGSSLYPGTSSCGGSTFDSCGALNPGQYWEFTFTEKGTWEFVNNVDKSNMASITVR